MRNIRGKIRRWNLCALLVVAALIVEQIALTSAVFAGPGSAWTSGTTVSALASGGSTSCVIISGAVSCWGLNANGQLGNGSTTTSSVVVPVSTASGLAGKTVTAVSPGGTHTCAIASGAVYCWGNNANGRLGNNSTTQSAVPVEVTATGVLAGKTPTVIEAGGSHTCVVASGAVYCWGANTNGQLGNSSTTSSSVPVAVTATGVMSGKTITGLATGGNHTCAIASDNTVFCWGLGTSGQLGNSASVTSTSPVAVTANATISGKTISAISSEASSNHTCLVASGAPVCWGLGTSGQIGNSASATVNVPTATTITGVLAGKTVTSIGLGTNSSCVVASGSPICWGGAAAGQLGNGIYSNSNVPVSVITTTALSGKTVTSITSGTNFGCVIASSAVYCWGDSASGQNGGVNYLHSNAPLPINDTGVLAGKTETDVSGGAQHSCVVASGAAYCWGNGASGRLGTNSTISQAFPAAVRATGVLSGKTVTAISAGGSHTCAIASGLAYCWGLGTSGQLGNNLATTSNQPVAVTTTGVLSGKTIASISAGTNHTCAVTTDGIAACWGVNTSGQLGNNSTAQSNVPVAVSATGPFAGKTIASIGAGQSHSCALTTDGVLGCWGAGSTGALGNGSSTQSSVPVAVTTSGVLAGKTVTQLSVGGLHNCVIASGAAYCWGEGSSNQIGDNLATTSTVPVTVLANGVLAGKTVTSITAGGLHSCAVAGGSTYCWGKNLKGQLGNGSTVDSGIPSAVSEMGAANGAPTELASGDQHTCALTAGIVYCWGLNQNSQLGMVTGSPIEVNVVQQNYSLNSKTYRIYADSTTVTPGAALAAANTPAQLSSAGQTFRLRFGIDSSGGAGASETLFANMNAFKLQFAAKSAGTCSAQTTGFSDITETTVIAFARSASVKIRDRITQTAADPIATTNPQSFIDESLIFTNNTDITSGNTGLWDVALKDNGAPESTAYCIRPVYASTSQPMELASAYPEVRSVGSLSLSIVDGGGAVVSSPSTTFNTAAMASTCSLTSATLGVASQKIRINNTTTSGGWSTSLAASGGATASWAKSGGGTGYDFNDPSGSPAGCNSGSDGDGLAGQLTVNPSTATITPQGGCNTTGISPGVSAGFSQSQTDVITLVTAAANTNTNCYFDVTNVGLSQRIPALQAQGSYTIDMTLTVVAQ